MERLKKSIIQESNLKIQSDTPVFNSKKIKLKKFTISHYKIDEANLKILQGILIINFLVNLFY